MMEVKLIHAPEDLRKTSKKLRAVENGKGIRTRLVKGLRKGAKPAQANVRKAALELPAYGRKHTGLRKKMADATGITVRTSGNDAGVRVKISRTRMGTQASLVKQSDTPGHWRHEVYGNRNVWVTQTWQRGWFENANKKSAPGVRREIRRVLDEIENDLSN